MKTKRQYFDAGNIELKRKGNSQLELIITEHRGDWSTGTKHEIHIELVPCFVQSLANQLWKCINSWTNQINRMKDSMTGGEE